MTNCVPLCPPSVCDCINTASIKIDVDKNNCVFVTIHGFGEAYVIAEDFVKVIKETQTDVFEGKHTFVIN